MIGNTTRGSNFFGLARYLTEDEGRVGWTSQRNLMEGLSPKVIAGVMSATASQSQAESPVYHLSVSIAPEEHLSEKGWNTDRLLCALELQEHQALVVAHTDQEHDHIHIAVNRVHPEKHRAHPLRFDYRKIEQTLREIEREWKLRETLGLHAQLPGQNRVEPEPFRRSDHIHDIRFAVRLHLDNARSWTDFAERLEMRGIRFQAVGRGMAFSDGEVTVKASEIDRRASRAQLEQRWGRLQLWTRQVNRLAWMIEKYAERDERWAEQAREAKAHRQVLTRGRAFDRGLKEAEAKYHEALAGFYAEPERAQSEIAAAAKKGGAMEVTIWVMQRPEVYGRVIDFERDVTRTYHQHQLCTAHGKFENLRRKREEHFPKIEPATQRLRELQVDLDRARQRARNLNQLRRIGRHIARLGGRPLLSLLRSSVMKAILPPQFQLPYRLALRALRLARGKTRSRGR